MGRYADVDYLLKNNAVKMDWSGQKWVSEVSLVSAIDLNVVQIVHGHWKHTFGGYVNCSVCGDVPLLNVGREYIESEYCPHCGTKMDEKIDSKEIENGK